MEDCAHPKNFRLSKNFIQKLALKRSMDAPFIGPLETLTNAKVGYKLRGKPKLRSQNSGAPALHQ